MKPETEINKSLKDVGRRVDKLLKPKASTYEQKLFSQYKRALDDINAELKDIYKRYASDIEQKKISISRLESLKQQIYESIIGAKKYDLQLTTDAIKTLYAESFELTGDSFDEAFGLDINTSSLNDRAIEAAIKNPYDKIGWQRRSKINTADLIETTRTEVVQGILRGQPYAATSKQLVDKLNIGAGKAITIVRTETGRAISTAQLEVFQQNKKSAAELDLEVERFWQHNSKRDPRHVHEKMDGQTADEHDNFIFPTGENAGKKTKGPRLSGIAAEDINCGCTIGVRIKNLK